MVVVSVGRHDLGAAEAPAVSRWKVMNAIDKLFRLIDWKIAVAAAVAAPVVVLLHELAHVFALDFGGIDAHLYGFSMAVPVGYSWDFKGLEEACVSYNANPSSIAYAALAGPIITLLIAYGALIAYHFKKTNVFWACSFSAIVLRTAGITENMPRFLDGTINTTDEAIAAHFLDLPLTSFYWLTLALGFFCIFLLFTAAVKGQRSMYLASAFVGGMVGYFGIDTLANILIFKPDVWGR